MARPRKNPKVITKICEGCNQEFTISSRKYRQRYCTKSCAMNSPSVLEKIKQGQQKKWDEKYGGLHPMQTDDTKCNFKTAIREKYGDTFFSSYLPEKSKQSKLERYGNKNYNNIEKAKKTCLEKYGVDNIRKLQSSVENTNQKVMNKHFDYLLSICSKNNIEMLLSRENYKGYHFSNKYKFKCTVCYNEFESDVYHLKNLFCNKCFPDRRLKLESSFFDFLKEVVPPNIEIKRNDRTVLMGKELDFYIPFKKLAFELNGLYWHSEMGGNRNKHYHLRKTKSCLFHGIKLIHIFENEWYDNPDLVKSMIRRILGYTSKQRIFSRKCNIREVDISEKNSFLNENHIQGEDRSTIKIGLYYTNELISLMTFRKTSRFDKKVEWELSRFCSKKDTSVIGGASRMFNYFIKNYSPQSIVSYSDRRFFSGEIYTILGFNFVHNTTPNYFYITSDYKGVKNRMSFQKHLLKKILPIFDIEKSEWENMKNNNFDRIWDCGSTKWIWKKST